MPQALDDRLAREKAAYDGGDVHGNSGLLQARFQHVFFSPNSRQAEQYLNEAVAQCAKGNDILDYGCYDGWMVPHWLTVAPRSITGIDLSETGIARAIANYGDKATFYAGDAHRTPFDDAAFDLVVGRAILHHLDMDRALKEICRILRPGGSAIFVEPLGDNPAAKLLRGLTPKARTADERALTKADIDKADRLFGGSSHLFYNLVTVPVAMLTSLTKLGPDNSLLRVVDSIDRRLGQTRLKYWMRSVVLVWHKA